MATKTIEISVCDICEDCCRQIDIPDKMMYYRGEACDLTEEEIENQIKKWRDDIHN